MLSKSKINIANQLDKMSLEEAVRGMVMTMSLSDKEQINKIFERLPTDDKKQAWEFLCLFIEKTSLVQSRLIFKAIMCVDFYSKTLNRVFNDDKELPSEEDKQAYLDNVEQQERLEKEIKEIDAKTNGVFNLPVLDEAYEGLSDNFDQWVVFLVRMLQDVGKVPKDKEQAKAYFNELSNKLAEERRESLSVRDNNKSS